MGQGEDLTPLKVVCLVPREEWWGMWWRRGRGGGGCVVAVVTWRWWGVWWVPWRLNTCGDAWNESSIDFNEVRVSACCGDGSKSECVPW